MSLHRRKRSTAKQLFRYYLSGFLVGSFLVCVIAIAIHLQDALQWTGVKFALGDLLAGFVFMAIIALAEEYLFRALLLRKLARHMPRWYAIIFSSLAFTAVHLLNPNIGWLPAVNVFLGGIVFALTFMVTRSLAVVAGFHAAWNFIQGPILGFAVSGMPFENLLTQQLSDDVLINGGLFGLEGSIICTVVLTVYAVIVARLLPR